MRFIIFNGEKSVDINDEIVDMYEKVMRPIDAAKIEVLLDMYDEDENTTKSVEELSKIVTDALAEEIDLFYYIKTPEGIEKIMAAFEKAKENMREDNSEPI